MTSPTSITPEERIIVALACLIGVLFLFFAPHSCKPGATAFSLSSQSSTAHEGDLAKTKPTKAPELAVTATERGTAASVASPPSQSSAQPQVSLKNSRPAASQTLDSSLNSAAPALAASAASAATVAASNGEAGAVPAENNLASSSLAKGETATTPPAVSSENALGTEEVAKRNEKLLQQITQLTAEKNFLKKEQQQAKTRFTETKNEYAATFKFARDQHQKEILALQQKNQALVEKLAAGSPSGAPVSPPKTETVPANPPTSQESKETQETEKKQAPAFAQSDDDLDQSRRVLVEAIREMDALSGEQLDSRYQELASKRGIKSSGRIRFQSGSSQAAGVELEKIAQIAKASPAHSQFLIVGFADRSGSASGNRRLSSQRAKFVAEQLGKDVGFGRVQAIYIGQTARFGPAAENRVVEIWQIPATPTQR